MTVFFQINQSLLFKKAKNEYKVETGRAKFNTSQMFVMEELAYGDKELEVEITSDAKSDFEIANFIMYHTMLPRLAIFKILQGVTKRELLNNQDILDEVTQLIKGILNDTKASNITSYEVINGYELDERNIFELDTITEADFEQEWRVFKAKSDRSSAMNEYYKLDSEGESKFAHKLENNENVLLFTDFKYEIVEHIGILSQRVPKDGPRNSTEFHGMVENQSMISETGHRITRKWVRVLRCLRMRC